MDVQDLYNNRFAGDKTLIRKNQIWQTLCKHFFQKYIAEDAVLVDIAAGYCEFVNNISAKEKIAFDLNTDTQKFADQGVTVQTDSFFNLPEYMGERKADIVFASNVLEHLDDKEQVIAAMKACATILRKPGGEKTKGGCLLILQPNIKYTKGAYWDFIDHKVPLTDQALVEAGEMCGLRTIVNIPKFLPYTTKSKLPKHPLLIWLYLKVMPISGFFMGQQSFLVLEKTDA